MHTRRRRGSAPVLIALGMAAAVAAACGDDGSSTGGSNGGGDDVTNDTRDAEVRAPANPDDGSVLNGEPDGYLTGQPEASSYDDEVPTYGYPTDAPSYYPGVAECSSCACPATADYCFGGATPRKDPMIAPAAASDASEAACPKVAAGTLGCTALPAGATDCASLIAALQPTFSCYLVCAYDGKTMTLYCPSP